jgi:hypothetical protein
VEATCRGRTSAGRLAEPYPRGDLPGSEHGVSHFFVVDPRDPPLDVAVTSPMWDDGGRLAPGTLERPARVRFRAGVPAEWSEAEGWVVVWMPGFLLEDRRLEVAAGREPEAREIEYAFDAESYRRDFPNIDRQPADTFVVTLAASGLDRGGKRRTRARVLVIQGPRVWRPEPGIGDRSASQAKW